METNAKGLVGMNRLLCVLVFSLVAVFQSQAVNRDDLSAEARALLPEGDDVVLVLADGREVRGIVVEQDENRVTLEIRREGSSIALKRPYQRSNISEIKVQDVIPVLADKLLETYQIDEDTSFEAEHYEKGLALFDEFLKMAPGAERHAEVTERRSAYAEELKHVRLGMEKVEGEWLTPVRAAVRKFDIYTRQIEVIERRRDFRTNDKVKQFYDNLIERRRAEARSLPEIMRNRMPVLLEEKRFDEAVLETSAFLHFWVSQVVHSEGPAAAMIRQMDFDYFRRLQDEQIMEAYRQSGLGDQRPYVPVPKDMVYIPGGYFLMGGNESGPDDSDFPMHIVFVDPFVIDKYEVTNADYRKFVEYVRRTSDYNMAHPDAPPLKKHDAASWEKSALKGDKQPVMGVDWFDAYAYANWVGKRLPTEAEWEKAARGMDGRKYPWGDTAINKLCINTEDGRAYMAREMDRQNPPQPPEPEKNFLGFSCQKKEDLPPPPPTVLPTETWNVDQLLPDEAIQAIEVGVLEYEVDSLSPYGLYHMLGNAAEWVADYFEAGYNCEPPAQMNPTGPETGTARVYRGGSYLTKTGGRGGDPLSTFRRYYPRSAIEERGITRGSGGQPYIGFRCAKSIDLVEN